MKYINEFLTARRLDGLANSTLIQYRMELTNLSNHLNKPTIIADTNDLRQYLSNYQYQAINTMCRRISTLKALYTWLVDEEYIEKNPMRKIKTPKQPALLPKALNKNDFDKIRYFSKTNRNQAILELLVSSGMRISELVNLDINDLDMCNRMIKIMGKGSKERIIHFSAIAKFCIVGYLTTRKDNNPALFIGKYGNRLSDRCIQQQIKLIGKKAGIHEKVTPHMLRHTCATNLYKNGADIGFIQEILGHSRPDTTKRYAVLDEDTKTKMYDKYAYM
ncbi:site-specific tyrosine recombinase/integron integrase [Dehalobacter restrictus]|uniref:Tyrosine-type recombinase/integrase n=1 Tax=Dehalobacter restrictus TaxID=55583 RepID=A0A857DDV7_9FIRM|nr:site-specific tyrosine recombinase/integron integrase [Dehalobacter restrictus]QGZ99433.1 tyrosine-type recombinase/integrase [Dehalobacter restrictus]